MARDLFASAGVTPPTLGDDAAQSPAQASPIEPGNIDLKTRPVVPNGNDFSTVRSMSVNMDGREVLLPTVSDDGRLLSNDEAVESYRKTGKHLGKFGSPDEANVYAKRLHEDQAKQYAPKGKDLFSQFGTPRSVAQMRREERQAQQTQGLYDQVRRRGVGLDYDTGTDWLDQAFLASADNDSERLAYLTEKYGKGNVGRDTPDGDYYIMKDGKKIVPSGGGMISSGSAHLAAGSPQMVGGTVGALRGGTIGATLGPVGAVVGGVVGGGLGAGGGKIVQEVVKAGQGMVHKSFGEEAEAVGKEALFGAGGEAAARGVGGIGRIPFKRGVLGGEVRPMLSETTPESRDLSEALYRRKIAPPLASALPGMKITQFHMALAEKLFGKFGETQRLGYVTAELERALTQAGTPAQEVPTVLAQILDPSLAISTKGVGEKLTATAAQKAGALQTDVEKAAARVETAKEAQKTAQQTGQKAIYEAELGRFNAEVDARVKALDKAANVKVEPGALATDVSEAIHSARQDLSKQAEEIYGHVWKLAPDPILPTAGVKMQARQIIAGMPPGTRTVFHQLAELPDEISLQQAHQWRTLLREASQPTNLAASGVVKSQLSGLKTAVNGLFDTAAENPGVASVAVGLMRDVDKQYMTAIRKFEDVAINKLVKDVKSGLPPDPEKVAEAILRPGFSERAAEVKKLVGDEMWGRVAAADYRALISASTKDGMLDGTKLAGEIEKRGRTFDVAHPYAKELRSLAKRLEERPNADIPVTALDGANVKGSVRALDKALQAQKAFTEQEWLAQLSRPGSMHDEALSHIVKPGHEDRLIRAFGFFGENSPEVAEIRQTFLKTVLKKAIVPTPTGVGRTVGGDAMEQALAGYTQKQLDLLLPGVGNDLRRLAKEAKFLFPSKGTGDTVAGFVAGAIKTALPFGLVASHAMGSSGLVGGSALGAAGMAWGWGFLLSRPAVVHYLANGVENNATREATRQAFRAIMRAGARGMLPDTGGLAEGVLPEPDDTP